MNKTTVFSKTGKGLLEIKNKSSRLPKDQVRVLNLVDGKATLGDLVGKSRVTEVELRKILATLSDGGFIKEFADLAANKPTSSAAWSDSSEAESLDFTSVLGPASSEKPAAAKSPAPPPPAPTDKAARKAASGSSQYR